MTVSALPRAPGLLQQSSEEDIRKQIGDLSRFTVMHNQVLVAIFIRPEKTAAGIYLPNQTLKEDVWQGKVGLVLKKGPLAFVSDNRTDFGGLDVEPGDWAVFRVSDGLQLNVNGVVCRLVEDVHIKAVTPDPLLIY